MKTCTKIKEAKAAWRKKRGEVEEAGREGRLLWEKLWLLWRSQIAASLCFQKNTGAPQSLGTAASQILVLNDVRNMAFWRATASAQLWRPRESHSGNASSYTETWHRLPLALVNTKNKGKENPACAHCGSLKTAHLTLLISYCLGLRKIWLLNRKYVMFKLHNSVGGWFGSWWLPATPRLPGQLMWFLAVKMVLLVCSIPPSSTAV